MKDPVSVLFEEFPYDAGKILASACGEAYVAIMLANGQIGVCSALNQPVETDPLLLTKPDLKRPDHRMLIVAYANAHVNYIQENLGTGDIFDQVDFGKKTNTVMVGYFPPLVEKFRKEGFPFTTFDQHKDYPELTPLSEMDGKLGESDCVIITSTTLINATFTNLIGKIRPGTDVLMLGPSTPLHKAFRDQHSVTRLFGMTFRPYDFEVLEIISTGLGTQSFSKRGKKVSL